MDEQSIMERLIKNDKALSRQMKLGKRANPTLMRMMMQTGKKLSGELQKLRQAM